LRLLSASLKLERATRYMDTADNGKPTVWSLVRVLIENNVKMAK
jgi:hypothetical protein